MAQPTEEYTNVGGFAAALTSRLGAQARVSRAIAFAWLCGGSAIAALLTAGGAALAFVGYSHMISIKSAADVAANALADALQRTELKTSITGSVSLAPGSEVMLASGQTVKLSEGASVKLDPNATVRVVGDLKIDMPQPSAEQLQTQAKSNSNELPFTDYTIFRSVSFSSGEVVSGWSYDLSDTIHPKVQYCYYAQNIERGLATKYILAVNGSARRISNPKASFDFDGALADCMWFSGY